MDKEILVGKINTLKIARFSQPGAYLESLDGSEVLLPNRYLTRSLKEGDIVSVFISRDSDDRLVALGERPIALLDEFGFFEITAVKDYGAFVDWGLDKELFVPKKFQKSPFRVGEKRVLRVVLDENTDRLVGDERVGRYLSCSGVYLKEREKVEILVLAKTPLGYKVIVENRFEGVVYSNEIFEKISVGDSREAFVKKVREDGKLDISLRAFGQERKKSDESAVLERLKKAGGVLEVTYKSEPEIVKELFGLSKKSFKAALTKLIENKKIVLSENKIELYG